jgi:hypothetical protein
MFRGRELHLAILTLSVLLSTFLPSRADGQVCFRGHPQARCSGFTVLEFSGAIRLNEKAGPSDRTPGLVYWSAGYLHNVGSRSALGMAFKLMADGDGHRYGPVLRYRRWLGSTWSMDIAPGLFFGGDDNFSILRFPSPTADVAINWGDRVAFAVGVDGLRQEGRGTSWESYAGLRFGTWLAPLAMLGLGIIAGASYN